MKRARLQGAELELGHPAPRLRSRLNSFSINIIKIYFNSLHTPVQIYYLLSIYFSNMKKLLTKKKMVHK